MKELKVIERLTAIRTDWTNCQGCEYLPECQEVKPVSGLVCRVFPVNPFTIFQEHFIKTDNRGWRNGSK
jgi:hypothetical protein